MDGLKTTIEEVYQATYPSAAKIVFSGNTSNYLPITTMTKCVSIIDTGYWDYERPHSRPTNCKNCGAPLHSDKCEYCGSEY